MHHGRDACRGRLLVASFEVGGGGKRSRHSRRMRSPKFYVSGKRPMEQALMLPSIFYDITLFLSKTRPRQSHKIIYHYTTKS